MRRLPIGLLAALAGLALACASPNGGATTPTPERPTIPTGTETAAVPTPEEPAIPVGAETAVAAARRQLAEKLGVAAEASRLALVETVDWPDASLGCPEPGKLYAQVITPGYRVVLTYAGKRYEFHADRSGRVVTCPD